jgi:SP family galactose:H+ symporter-like MFS transporter
MKKSSTTGGANAIVTKVSLIAALAGLLFGLDIAYVNGSLELIVKDFALTVPQSEKIAGVLLFGAAIGAVFSGWFSRRFGRKKVLLLASLIFALFTFLGVFAPTYKVLLIARFIIGLAVGIASFVAPLYLSEIAPFKIRGRLIAMYQLMITIGILAMFLSNAALIHFGSWRLMMSVIAIPALVMFIGALFLPESPRWLVLVGKPGDAEKVLQKIRTSDGEVAFELNEIKETVKIKSSGWSLLSKSYFRKVLLLGILLQALQQFSGMNAFMYYSGQVFKAAGLSNPVVATIIIGLVNMLTTLIAIKYVDKLGRKPILYFGLTILVVSCAVVGALFKISPPGTEMTSAEQWLTLIFSLLFIFGFAVSLGPIVWILCSEIFPLKGRDFGITITTATNWISNTIIGSFTLTWFQHLGVGGTFWMFGLFNLIGFLIVGFITPETKNIPLEELEKNLENGVPLRKLGMRETS